MRALVSRLAALAQTPRASAGRRGDLNRRAKNRVSVQVKTRKSPTTVDSVSCRARVSGNVHTHAAVCAYGGPEGVDLAHPKGLTSSSGCENGITEQPQYVAA